MLCHIKKEGLNMKQQKRVPIIDTIRGFALLGILLVNMKSFSSPVFIVTMYGVTPNSVGFDRVISIFYQIFIQMRFYPIFAILFGLSFYLFIKKSFKITLFIRRMIILFFFGMIHLIFIWYGDILHIYAVTSLFLLLFYKVSSKWILFWAITLLALYYLIIGWNTIIPNNKYLVSNEYHNILSTYVSMYKDSTYKEWVFYRLNIEVFPVLFQLPFVFIPVLAWFLLGLYIGKVGIYERNSVNIVRVKSCWKSCLYVSLGLLILTVLAHFYFPDIIYFLTSITGAVMAILYISSIYVFFDHPFVKLILYPLRYVGRMSLSNYLFQSILMVSFFRITHLYNKVSLSEGLVMSVIVFLFQLLFSKYWLSHFHQGPLEWIWRSISLRKVSPFLLKK